MASIHIILPDQSQAVFEDFEIPDLVREGRVTPETWFWQEGMPEWRQLAEFMAQEIPAEAPPMEEADAEEAPIEEKPTPGRDGPRSSRGEKKKGFFATLFGSGISSGAGASGSSESSDSRSSRESGGSSSRRSRSGRSKSRSKSEEPPEDDTKSAKW